MKTWLSIGLILLSFVLDAQEVQWGPKIDLRGKTFYEKTILLPEGELLVVQRKKNIWSQNWEPLLTKLSAQRMGVRRQEQIPMKYEKNKLEYKDLNRLGDKLYLFSTYFNESKRTNYLFVSELSNRSFKPKRLMKLADSRSDRDDLTPFYIRYSSDTSKVAIISNYNSRKETSELKLTLMDSNFNYIYEKIFDPKDLFSGQTLEQIEVSNAGEVFILGKRPIGKSTLDKSTVYSHHLLKINALGYPDTNFSPDLKKLGLDENEFRNFFITDFEFVLQDSVLLMGGLFSLTGGNSSKGTVFFKYMLSDFELKNAFFDYFDFEILTAQLSDRGLRKAQEAYEDVGIQGLPELSNLKIIEFIERSDGGLVYLTEQSENFVQYDRSPTYFFDPVWGYQYNPYSSANNRIYYHHIYNDIFAFNVSHEGWIQWTARLPKSQHTINDRGYYSSFAQFTLRDKIGFIYNENKRNLDNDQQRYSYEGEQGVPLLATVSVRGETGKQVLNPMPSGIQVVPKASRQINQSEILLVGLGRNYMQIGLLRQN